MISDKRIRELCAHVVTTNGAEFQVALAELQEAIELRLGPDGELTPDHERDRKPTGD